MGRWLSMSQISTVQELHKLGWSNRKIASELGINRKTVARVLKALKEGKRIALPQVIQSKCLPYKKIIEEKLLKDLSAQRIYQDLKREFAFSHSYESVKRFVNKLRTNEQKVFARLETSPGHEAQVDFGLGAPTKTKNRYSRPHLFVMTLSFSRHSYQEVVWHQNVETFIRCHERAFQFFGGIPKVIRLDNLKAGVLVAHLFEPELNRFYEAYAHHAGFIPVPCLPRKPEHKGKVESNIGYVQDNAVKGLRFDSLEQQNKHLRHWNATIAFPRRHGTTKRLVTEMFEEELPYFKPLPQEEFIMFRIAKRRVHPDAHIEVDSAYYSVPHRLLGKDVEVHYNESWVKVYFADQLLVKHAKSQPGFFQTCRSHLPRSKTMTEEELLQHLLNICQDIGESCFYWAKKVWKDRRQLAFRTLSGIKQLKYKYEPSLINAACAKALDIGSVHYHTVQVFCESELNPEVDKFLKQHEIIREISYFQQILDNKEEDNE